MGSFDTVVIGAGGGIGGALAEALGARGARLCALSRRSAPALDLLDEASIAAAAAHCGAGLALVVDATGMLHEPGLQPEKGLRQLDAAHLARSFALNATGPALLMKHFLPLLSQRGVFATLSARVGSISDNHLGGWYSYRASKAALNQLMRTAAVELKRTRPLAICVALHPGTVETPLSAPFAKTGLDVQSPAEAAGKLLRVLDAITPESSGRLVDQNGEIVPF